MGDDRLLRSEEFLLQLIVTVMRDGRAMSASEIAKAVSKSSGRKLDRRTVEAFLAPVAGEAVFVSGALRCRFIRQRPRGLFQRRTRWRLIEAPASPPDTSGAPVPAWPYRPRLSGAAAANLTFRDDDPPTNAIGKSA